MLDYVDESGRRVHDIFFYRDADIMGNDHSIRRAWCVSPSNPDVAKLTTVWSNGVYRLTDVETANKFSRLGVCKFFTFSDFFHPTRNLDAHIGINMNTHEVRRLKILKSSVRKVGVENCYGVKYTFENLSEIVPTVGKTYISIVNKSIGWLPIYNVNESKFYKHCYELWDFGNVRKNSVR